MIRLRKCGALKKSFFVQEVLQHYPKAGLWKRRLTKKLFAWRLFFLVSLYKGPWFLRIKKVELFMNRLELFVLRRQADVLRKLLPRYGGKTIENVLHQIESRIEYYASEERG